MKTLALFLILSFNAVALLALAAPQTPAAPPAPPMHHAVRDHAMAMHHHMQMQEQITKMRATLDKMKTNLGKISDPALKQQAQLDVELWESMVQPVEDTVKMMPMQGVVGMMGGADHASMESKDTPKPCAKLSCFEHGRFSALFDLRQPLR